MLRWLIFDLSSSHSYNKILRILTSEISNSMQYAGMYKSSSSGSDGTCLSPNGHGKISLYH